MKIKELSFVWFETVGVNCHQSRESLHKHVITFSHDVDI
jgi:hypothetical protein